MFLTAENECQLQGDAKPFFCANYIPFVDNPGSKIYDVCHGIGKGREWTAEEVEAVYDKMMARLVIER